MVQWMRSHKCLTSVLCVLLAAALVGTAFLIAGRLHTVEDTVASPLGTYSGIDENQVVSVTLADGTAATQYAGTRDPWLWPFASDSIWNMPIGSNATLTTSPVFTGTNLEYAATRSGGNAYGVDEERIYLTSAADKQYMVIRGRYACSSRSVIKSYISDAKRGTYFTYSGTSYNILSSLGVNYEFNKGMAYWPTGLVVNDGGNEIAAIVQPDRRSVAQFQSNRKSATINDGLALFPYDGTYDASVPDSDKFLISNMVFNDLYGDGIYGSHWGSALSAMGGSIREGEISGDDQIHHALKLNVNHTVMFYGLVTQTALDTYNNGGQNGKYAKGDLIPGFTWPATKDDGQSGSSAYTGSNPFVSQGSLLAISQSDYNTLYSQMQTEVGRKFLYALRYYGCYIVDDTAYSPWGEDPKFEGVAWSMSDKEIAAINDEYGIDLSAYRRKSGSSGATKQYCEDMEKIFVKLRAVTNNTIESVGGGGTPSKPLAPEIYPLEGIAVANQTIPLGADTTLQVVCTPTNASVQSVTYASSNPSVIQVTNDGKTIRGLKSGSATITVTSDECQFTATCTVTVGGGDVNGDGKVDVKDYTTLESAINNHSVPTAAEQKKRYDIDGDNSVDEDDLNALKAILKGGAAQ